ncbi:MAG: hypothetical protein ACRDVE_19785, partial [Actinocrinis sp.]
MRLNVWGATARAAQLAEVDARETAAEHGWTVAEVAAAVGRRRRAARRPPLLRLGSAALVD